MEHDEKNKIDLFPLQETIVSELRSALSRTKRVILMSATGVGKTIIATWIILKCMENGVNDIVFVCDRINLVDQTSKVFSRYGIDHKIIQGSDRQREMTDATVTVASVQTLARREIASYDLIFYDEVHTWYSAHEKILLKNKNAMVVGLTATPFNAILKKYFKIIEPIPMEKLIVDGYLADYEIFCPDQTIDLSNVRTRHGEFVEDDLLDAASKSELIANIFSNWHNHREKIKKTIVFAVNISHAKKLEQEFSENGENAIAIHSDMDSDAVKKNIDDFRNDKINVLISVEMIVKGFDVPDVDCIIFATATKSKMKWVQSIGRGLRAYPGKTKCLIFDHGSNTTRLGFPDEISLDTISTKKPRIQKCPYCNHEITSKMKTCPECGLILNESESPGYTCRECGYIMRISMKICPICMTERPRPEPPQVKEGKLIRLLNPRTATIDDKQNFLSQLNLFAEMRNYKKTGSVYVWALKTYESFFNEKPKKIDKSIVADNIQVDVMRYIKRQNYSYYRRQKTKA